MDKLVLYLMALAGALGVAGAAKMLMRLFAGPRKVYAVDIETTSPTGRFPILPEIQVIEYRGKKKRTAHVFPIVHGDYSAIEKRVMEALRHWR